MGVEGGGEGGDDGGFDVRRVAEAHLALRRMHVHVHLLRRHLDEEEEGRPRLGASGGVRLLDGVGDDRRGCRAAVHEDLVATSFSDFLSLFCWDSTLRSSPLNFSLLLIMPSSSVLRPTRTPCFTSVYLEGCQGLGIQVLQEGGPLWGPERGLLSEISWFTYY